MSTKIKPRTGILRFIERCIYETQCMINKVISDYRYWKEVKRRYHEDRKAIIDLLRLNNKQLNDIGLSRADVIWASKLPKDQIATRELQKIRK